MHTQHTCHSIVSDELVQPVTRKKRYTLDEVKEMVASALEAREAQIRDEFTNALSELLQGAAPYREPTLLAEQYERFCKFNEDFLNQQPKKGDLSYLS